MKRLTKKVSLLAIVALLSTNAQAQWAVFDASNLAQSVKLVSEAVEQSRVLGDTYNELKKANEMFTQVSSKLKQVSIISEVMQEQVALMGRAGNLIMNLNTNAGNNYEIVSAFKKQTDEIIKMNNSNVEFLKTFLTDGLNMSDGERLQLALKVRQETKQRDDELKTLETRARATIDVLNLYDTMSSQNK